MAQTTFDKQGHRGCRGLMPENTIPAMKKAIDLGVTLELDISFSKEKLPIVSHDQVLLSKIALKPNGDTISKAEEKTLLLYCMPYAQIRQYDVGKKFNPSFPTQQKMAAYIPLLAELIDSAETYAKQKGVALPHYNIETKTTPQGDGIEHPAPAEFVKLLMQVINKKKIQNRVIIQSFDPRTLEIVHHNYSEMPTALLVSNKDDLQKNLAVLSFKPTIFSPDHKMVNPGMVAACHEAGIKVIPWTVNDPRQIAKMKQLGVDGIISDYPDRL
ncbi:glycerophosphodiester phosphodiesterase family protein [Mucilaginibacter lacusdianchii]|uniref:glycerophosphodiester phosphodiesterase family protein n=1 Tax=Mucilaginibacter lacusdianchii TaxID=2684211 RepID=UPI001E4ADAA7|nr:glycerophosphodiester phosphodiesterase family protein [Mucilaginibacter sp. JXJ CY 39]